jgi:hypothetical protein
VNERVLREAAVELPRELVREAVVGPVDDVDLLLKALHLAALARLAVLVAVQV